MCLYFPKGRQTRLTTGRNKNVSYLDSSPLFTSLTLTSTTEPPNTWQRMDSTPSTTGSMTGPGRLMSHHTLFLSLFSSFLLSPSLYLISLTKRAQKLFSFLNKNPVYAIVRYPLGRIIGGTIYPGLMVTASAIYNILNALNITLNVREVCQINIQL